MQLLTIFSSLYVMAYVLFGGGMPPKEQPAHCLTWYLAVGFTCGRAFASAFLAMADDE